MRIPIILFCCFWSKLFGFDTPPGIDSFRWQYRASILLEDNRIYYLGDNSIEGRELEDITDKADLKKIGDFYEFTFEDNKSIILPGDSRHEVLNFQPENLGKLNDNIYGDPKFQTESYQPGNSNIARIITKTFFTQKINNKPFKYNSSWLLLKYNYGCLCHPQIFTNEIPPWIQGTPRSAGKEEILIKFKEPTSGLAILNGFVNIYFPEYFRQYSRMKEIQVVHKNFNLSVVFDDSVKFTDINLPQEVSEIKLIVNSIYEGSKFKNFAISAVSGYSPPKNTRYSNKELIKQYRKKP